MPRRKSLDEALGGGEQPTPAPTSPSAEPPFAPEKVVTTPPHEMSPPAPDRYKLTVVLEEGEHEQLERITDAVLAELRPHRVGKGWRTKVIRALLAEAMSGADPDPRAVRRITDRLRES